MLQEDTGQNIFPDNTVKAMVRGEEDIRNRVACFTEEIIRAKKMDLDNINRV